MQRRERAATVVVAVFAVSAHLTTNAVATFRDTTDQASMSVSTASVAAPTDLAAASRCVLLVPTLELSWTATTSDFVSGYRVYRRPAGGTFELIGSVTGRTTTAFSDATVVAGDSYSYVVDAVYEGWSARSAEVTTSVPLVCA